MRRAFLALSLAAAVAVAFFAAGVPSSSGGEQNTLTITKIVEGDGPVGGYVIEYSCNSDSGAQGGSVAFDAAGPGAPETQEFSVNAFANCFVNETDSNGADTVTYDCLYVPFDGGGGGASPEGDEGCTSDQEVTFGSFGNDAHITVTNTFDPEVLPDDEDPEPEPDVAPDVVDATPAFTG